MDLPPYFVLDGLEAYTSFSKPDTIYFEGQVRPKGYSSAVKVVSIRPMKTEHCFTTVLDEKNIPVYKSNLQKCIRRQLHDQAIRTAYAMMSVNAADMLRRLPIIMIEDVLPHPCIVPLVWWMMATTKGYALSDDEVSYVLGMVHLLCSVPERQVSKEKAQGVLPDWSELPTTERDTLWALEFRKAYRGMSCDVNMIDYVQRNWFSRFTKSDRVWATMKNKNVFPVELTTLGICDKDDLILEAIDQHCFSWIPKKLNAKFPEYSEYQIKGAIWFYRSRTNLRKLCAGSPPLLYVPELEPVYQKIRKELDGLCQWIFSNLI